MRKEEKVRSEEVCGCVCDFFLNYLLISVFFKDFFFCWFVSNCCDVLFFIFYFFTRFVFICHYVLFGFIILFY